MVDSIPSIAPAPHPTFPPASFLPSTLTHPLFLDLILSSCDLKFHLINARVFFCSSSQLAEILRPLRVSIDVMSPNRSAFMLPLKFSEVRPQTPVHIREYIYGKRTPSWAVRLSLGLCV